MIQAKKKENLMVMKNLKLKLKKSLFFQSPKMDLEKELLIMILELQIEAVRELLELLIPKEMAMFLPHFPLMKVMNY